MSQLSTPRLYLGWCVVRIGQVSAVSRWDALQRSCPGRSQESSFPSVPGNPPNLPGLKRKVDHVYLGITGPHLFPFSLWDSYLLIAPGDASDSAPIHGVTPPLTTFSSFPLPDIQSVPG